MQLIQADLVELTATGNYDVVVHGCNCMNQMGKGVAQALKNKWNQIYDADLQTVKGDVNKLGTYSSAVVEINGNHVTVINAYTQYHYNGAGVLVQYDAVESVLKQIKDLHSGKKIIMSKIGCGLAKGDWNVVGQMVATQLNGEDVTVVEYNKPM